MSIKENLIKAVSNEFESLALHLDKGQDSIHIEADQILLELLETLGYEEIVKIIKN